MRGARGGVTLARPPQEINLLEVIEAIDGPILVNECVGEHNNCTQEDCPMRGIWKDAQSELVNRLKTTTFDQFVKVEDV